jgi:hypothetical protein
LEGGTGRVATDRQVGGMSMSIGPGIVSRDHEDEGSDKAAGVIERWPERRGVAQEGLLNGVLTLDTENTKQN